MKRLLPNRSELAIFATLALLCAALVHSFGDTSRDLRLAILAFPIFLVSAIMGLRRNWAAVARRELEQTIVTRQTESA